MHTQSSRRRRADARLLRRTLRISLIVIAASAYDVPQAAAQQPNIVSGTVRSSDGRPLAGATIRISGATGAARGTTVRTQSDQNGNYRIEVRPGHYDVDAFYDLKFNGQTYRELWLDRTNEGCERQLSANGIVRHFVLRLSGPLRCTANFNPNEPTSYAGGMVLVTPGDLPAAATVRFTFTPVGALADGTKGRIVTFERTAAMLAAGGGRLGQTAWLYDIPLGRYHVSAEAALPGGTRRALMLRAGGAADTSVEISFPARQMMPYGMQSASLTIVAATARPSQPAARIEDTPDPAAPPAGGATRLQVGGLPIGRYECSHLSPYAGEIPNGRTIVILDDGQYQAWGGSGTYRRQSAGAIQWSSGPLAQRGVTVTFTAEGNRAVLTVRGGAAADDPGGTNRCVRAGG